VAAAVCSSIIAPQDYRTFARSGATVFTNSASLSIFKGSPLFAWQQKSLARFMAVANARYFLQSANAASAYSIDINGKQTAEVKGRSTLLVEAKTNTVKTPYVYSGEWLLYLGFGMVICIMIYEGLNTYGTKKDSQSKSTKKTKVVHKS
jgi:apolipoprotein N-acyltransferase